MADALPPTACHACRRDGLTALAADHPNLVAILHVGGAESVHAVYVNGVFVGYGTDSRLPSEYAITSAVRPGRNDLAIVVIRYSAGSYVEDQDQWWMAGLHRGVFLESRSPVRIADLRKEPGVEHQVAQP